MTTSHAAYLPPVAQPPHDPKRYLLAARNDWRLAATSQDVEIDEAGRLRLVLHVDPAELLHPAGSMGGLVLPAVAAHLGRDLFLVAADHLLRFDPCCCQFETLPCGGHGSVVGQLDGARGLAACGSDLFVADTGNHRVQIFTTRGFRVRAVWSSPAGLSQPWQPVAIAISRDRRVLVADQANSCVHVFSYQGTYLFSLDNLSAINALAIDVNNLLYVLMAGETALIVIDIASKQRLQPVSKRSQIAKLFPCLPIAVALDGSLDLSALCQPPRAAGSAVFDLMGMAIAAPEVASLSYANSGTYVSQALDSRIYQCQWDRLELQGDLPVGCRLQVLSYSAETALPDSFIDQLAESDWAGDVVLSARDFSAGRSDLLLRATPGRYLWLKILLTGPGDASPTIERLVMDYPRISLRRYLPAVYGAEALSAEFTDRFLAIFDRGFRQLEAYVDQQARWFDPDTAPAEDDHDFLSWLASWVGLSLERHWPLPRRRRFLKQAAALFRQRGTLLGLQRYLWLYLGLDEQGRGCLQQAPRRSANCAAMTACGQNQVAATSCAPCTQAPPPPAWQPPLLVLEHYRLRRWLFLGKGRLSQDAQLWGDAIVNRSRLGDERQVGSAQLGVSQLKTTQDPFRDPFHVYAHQFSVFVPARLAQSETAKHGLERLLDQESPAHTSHQIVYVKPRMRIGVQAVIGFDAVVGCYPEGVVLDQSRLGRASVLGSAPHDSHEQRIGLRSQVGSTTHLI